MAKKKIDIEKILRMFHSSFHEDRTHTRTHTHTHTHTPTGCSLTTEELPGAYLPISQVGTGLQVFLLKFRKIDIEPAFYRASVLFNIMFIHG